MKRSFGDRCSRAFAGGIVLAALQAAALAAVMLAWRSGPGSWGGGFYVMYFVAMVLLAPALGWTLAARVVGAKPALWLAWPVSMANLFVVLFGHGFEDAGLPVWMPGATIAVCAFIFGTEAFFRRGFEEGP